MWESRTKHDLIIEVWEKLDCENVGRIEIEAIETVVRENYGDSPTDTPMRLARLLADEGAELRHSEILELDVERRTAKDELPLLSRPLDVSSKSKAVEAIQELDRARTRFLEAGKAKAFADLRKKAIAARDQCIEISGNRNKSNDARANAAEIAEWLSMWIQSPEIYTNWFKAKYPDGLETADIER